MVLPGPPLGRLIFTYTHTLAHCADTAPMGNSVTVNHPQRSFTPPGGRDLTKHRVTPGYSTMLVLKPVTGYMGKAGVQLSLKPLLWTNVTLPRLYAPAALAGLSSQSTFNILERGDYSVRVYPVARYRSYPGYR